MKTKINILSPGRFHVCDLARELNKQGFDVKFYSFVPAKRTEKFGLPRKCSASLFLAMIPFLLLEKRLFKGKRWASRLRINVQDFLTGIYMRKCDILIAMSGDFVFSLKIAKKHGSTVILERGSKHILEQKRILENIPSLKGKNPVPDINVKRELEGYKIADYISIASLHVKSSFEKYNIPEDRLFVNPYGVDLSMFKPIKNIAKKFDIIMVGGWSYRKGCDLITKAIPKTRYNFLHVGGIVDLPFPNNPQMIHIDSVDQTKLIEYYNLAKIFILPSREDGFGMVLSQALACNLPLVGSPDCGAPDLKQIVSHPEYITILEDYTEEALIKAIDKTINMYNSMDDMIYGGEAINNLTWEAYGRRYADFINSKVLKK